MPDDAHLVPGSFRPPAEWYRQRTVTRMTPEGLRETSIVDREVDCRAIARAARGVINASSRATGRKLIAMQLVDICTVEHRPLPRLVIRALDCALKLGGHYSAILRNRKIAQLCGEGLSHEAVASRIGISTKSVQRHQDPVPDPWPDATVVLASYRPMRISDDDLPDCRPPGPIEEMLQTALAPIVNLAIEPALDRQSIFDLVLWFSERQWPLPRPVRWAVAVALGLGDLRGMSPHYFEKLGPSPGRQWQLEADRDGEPVIVDDGDGEPVFRAVEVEAEKRVGMRLSGPYASSIELEVAERIRRGRPYDQALLLKNLAVDARVHETTLTAWAATDRWKTTVSSRAEYPIRNAVQLEAIALLRGRELSADDLAMAIDVEPSIVATWRQDADYRSRIDALLKKMRAADQQRTVRLKKRLASRGSGHSS